MNFLRTIFILSMAILQWGCSANHERGNVSASSMCHLSYEDVFRDQYHPFLKKNCSGCHSSGGSGTGAFADPDPSVAIDQFALRGDAINRKAVDPTHQPPYTGSQHEEFINSAKRNWDIANQEALNCMANSDSQESDDSIIKDPDPSSATIELALRSLGDTSTTKKTIKWNLGDSILKPSGISFAETEFSIDVISQTSPTGDMSYELSNPTLKTGAQALHLVYIDIAINGIKISSATTYKGVNRRVAAHSSDPLSLTTMVVPYDVRSSDRISIGFGFLEVVDFSPVTLAQLNSGNGVFALQCLSCHNASNAQGSLDLSQRDPLVADYMVSPYNANSSEIFRRMNNPNNPMPPSGLLSDSDIEVVKNWIFAGAPE